MSTVYELQLKQIKQKKRYFAANCQDLVANAKNLGALVLV